MKQSEVPKKLRERNLYGSEFEIKLRNELSLKAVARECADWIRKKVCFKSNRTNAGMPAFATVDDTTYFHSLRARAAHYSGTKCAVLMILS